MNDRVVRVRPSDKIAVTRVQNAQRAQAQTEQFVRENEAAIGTDVAQEVLQERQEATRVITEQASQQLRTTNSHIQTIPSAPADPNDNTPLIDRAVAEEQARREAAQPIPPPPPDAPPVPAPSPAVGAGPTPGASAQNSAPSPAPRATSAAPGTVAQPASSNSYLERVLDPFRVRGINWDIQDNILNEYDRYAYHFRLLMVNDQDSNDRLVGSKIRDGTIPTVTIAESGVTTGFNLVSVQMQDAVSPNFRTRNTVTTEIDMTITEAYGMTLIDRMFLASRQLGIRNWRLAPMILELTFKYYDQEGFIVSSTAEPIRKIYKLVLVDTESTLTEVGSTYRIKATASGSIGFKDFWFIIPQTYKVVAGQTAAGNAAAQNNNARSNSIIQASSGTVGEFFAKLGQQLTDFYREQRTNAAGGTSTTPLIYYNFSVAPTLAEKPINFSNQTNARRLGFSTPGSANQEITIGRGVSISDLIDDICASLVDTSFFTPADSATTGQIRVPRVECSVDLIGYDVLLNDYVRQFNYVIGVLETLRPTPTVEHGRRFQTNIENQTSRAAHTANKKLVKKFYPFYYTGMNTEIIKLDLTFNQMHIISLPLHDGNTLPLATLGSSVTANIDQLQANYRVLSQTIRQQQQQIEQYEQTDQQLNAIVSRRPGQSTAERSALESEIVLEANQGLTPLAAGADLAAAFPGAGNDSDAALQQNINRIVGERRAVVQSERFLLGATIGDNQARLAEVAEQIQQLRTGSVVFFNPRDNRSIGSTNPEALQLYQQAERARERAAQRQSPAFAEDIAITSYNAPVDNAGQYTYAADPRDIANYLARSATTADNTNEVRGVYTTILAQLYDRQGQHLTEIELDIKGDPYWLGLSNVERESELNEYINNRAAAQTGVTANFGRLVNTVGRAADSSYANFYDSDASFLLLFRPGDQPNEQTGYMDFKDSVFFNGIYHTIEVTHMFNNGQFTQKLRAVRDLININAVRDAPQTATVAATPAAASAATPSVPAASPAGQVATPLQGAAATTPNASPANLARSRAAQVVSADAIPGSSTSGQGGAIATNSPEFIARARAEAALFNSQIDAGNRFATSGQPALDITGESRLNRSADLTGEGRGGADITGEGRLQDPTSLTEPRRVLNGRPVVNAVFNAQQNTIENTGAAPGQTVYYGDAELAAIRAGRLSN